MLKLTFIPNVSKVEMKTKTTEPSDKAKKTALSTIGESG